MHEHDDGPRVSVIVPAFRAATTIPATIASLRTQTFAGWEAIIVDDGSPDETVATALLIAAGDPRIRVLSRTHGGVSAARNEGIARARASWLLFLDADDTIEADMLRRMFDAIDEQPEVDAVCCGWRRIARDGTPLAAELPCLGDDAFATFARYCAVLIHTCVIRKDRVLQVGGFDESLVTCEDWDLWLRIARLGVRWITVPDVLVEYRHRPGSLTTRTRRLWGDAQRVLSTAYGPDARVPTAPRHNAAGRPPGELGLAHLELACWAAGMLIGSGDDAADVPEPHEATGPWQLVEADAADSFFRALVHGLGGGPERVARDWQEILPRVAAWLDRFETASSIPGIARRLERRTEALAAVTAAADGTVGRTRVATIDITRPIPDVDTDPGCSTVVRCRLIEEIIGSIDLPLPDGRSGSREVADAIAHAHAWRILGVFFKQSVYREVVLRPDGDRLTAWRGRVQLAPAFAHDVLEQPDGLHDTIGWVVLLQEIWGDAQADNAAFYSADAESAPGVIVPSTGAGVVVEASADLPWLRVNGDDVLAVLTVGGVLAASTRVRASDGLVSPSGLRAALTMAAGLGLCRAAVRRAIIGKPFDPAIPLRARLAAEAAGRRSPDL